MPMITGVFMGGTLLLLFELRFRYEIRRIIRAACCAHDGDQLARDLVVLELVGRRVALQADEVFGLDHQAKDTATLRGGPRSSAARPRGRGPSRRDLLRRPSL